MGQDSIRDDEFVFVPSTGPHVWSLGGSKGMMVSVNLDTGAVAFGEAYDLDEAARTFWLGLGRKAPSHIPAEPDYPWQTRIRLTIEFSANMDRVPGWGYQAEDWVDLATRDFLRQSHYSTKAVVRAISIRGVDQPLVQPKIT